MNGKIYFAPNKASQVLGIGPEAQAAEEFGPELNGESKYSAGGLWTKGWAINHQILQAGWVPGVGLYPRFLAFPGL